MSEFQSRPGYRRLTDNETADLAMALMKENMRLKAEIAVLKEHPWITICPECKAVHSTREAGLEK